MGFWDQLFRRKHEPEAQARPSVRAEAQEFTGFDDPAFLEFVRAGVAGGLDPGLLALRNMAVLRCVSLISESVGMLPLNLIHDTPEKPLATENPAYLLLKRKPNAWQTPYEFKALMQLWVLVHGNAYARVIWSMGRPVALIPMPPTQVTPRLEGFEMAYDWQPAGGNAVTLKGSEVLHLRDLGIDAEKGRSRVRLSAAARHLADQAEAAALTTFKTGNMAGGTVEVPNALSDQAYARMRKSLDEDIAGVMNAGRFVLLEEGAKATKWASTAADAQQIENRKFQIEEVARAFGVPRPLLMMDDTSWGSGIEQLGIFFVQYGLAHWFTVWEQALERVLLADDATDLRFKFNEKALLRGTINDQANFFSKALGAGGTAPFMTQNEVREVADLPRVDDPSADQLKNPMTQETGNDATQTA